MWCSLDQDLLDGAFQNRVGITAQASVFQPTNAALDDRSLNAIIPVDPTENLASVSTDDDLGKAMVAAEGPFVPLFPV